MIITPLLASTDIEPMVVALFVGPILLGLLCLVLLRVRRSGGKRSQWGLAIGLVPTIIGALLIFFFFTVRGGAPHFFYVAAALPLLVGIRLLQVWSRPGPP